MTNPLAKFLVGGEILDRYSNVELRLVVVATGASSGGTATVILGGTATVPARTLVPVLAGESAWCAQIGNQLLILGSLTPGAVSEEVTFSHPGEPTVAEMSARWYPRRTSTLSSVLMSLETAGSTSSVVTIYKNGVSEGTVTVAASANLSPLTTFSEVLVMDTDYLQVSATTWGTGAAKPTVQCRLT